VAAGLGSITTGGEAKSWTRATFGFVKRDEHTPEMTDQSNLDQSGQLDFPDATNTFHILKEILTELFHVVTESEEIKPLFDGRRSIHFVKRSGNQ
jgi:hypothetical protein